MNQGAVVEYLREMVDEVAYLDVEPDQPLVVDSLVAAQVKWRVDLDLEVELPLEDYLRGLTLRELAELIESGGNGGGNGDPSANGGNGARPS